ncbi:MAG: peptide ABC transporter ATP-binding protein [Firmicutes bacterium HGW-Firmicutes-7]|nr:MAG: peptide ABC transporter ATP-binding protein [Firmicutes bacterium HGW-Firmicutes-7]
MTDKILQINNLKTSFYTHVGEVKAIRGISLSLEKGGTLGIVGESGSGKSVTSLSIMRLLQYPGKIIDGEIIFENENLANKSNKAMRNIRGNKISMIFQDPMTSLNPVMKIGHQIMESMLLHRKITKAQAKEKAIEMLELVGIPSPKERFDQYPHEFSGGMRQRAMIAMALACEPALLIADEPTTALDVTIQAQILDLMKDLNNKLNMAIILITHDLGVVADVCQDVIVMYGGLIMESGSAHEIFSNPSHPYTAGLLNSIARPDLDENQRLVPINGTPPDLLSPPKGCPFYARCSHAMEICNENQPPFFEVEAGHQSSCWLLHEDAPKVNLKNDIREGR